jgi:hypothetical protein
MYCIAGTGSSCVNGKCVCGEGRTGAFCENTFNGVLHVGSARAGGGLEQRAMLPATFSYLALDKVLD